MAPDYELDDEIFASTNDDLKLLAHPLREQILDLVLDRAATVTELAQALDRPKSSLAYHVDLLVDGGLLKVVRTRKVRAIEERFYGRVARTIVVGQSRKYSFLATADAEAVDVDDDVVMQATLRHARIPTERAHEFFARVAELAIEFSELERDGDRVWGFVASVYPTDLPTLPEPAPPEPTPSEPERP